jgi:hypothetical protein
MIAAGSYETTAKFPRLPYTSGEQLPLLLLIVCYDDTVNFYPYE